MLNAATVGAGTSEGPSSNPLVFADDKAFQANTIGAGTREGIITSEVGINFSIAAATGAGKFEGPSSGLARPLLLLPLVFTQTLLSAATNFPPSPAHACVCGLKGEMAWREQVHLQMEQGLQLQQEGEQW